MKKAIIQQEALSNALNNRSIMNFVPIFEGFMARGIPESEIKPRENVFTYNAWKALGRQVRRGEHGVKVVTFIQCDDKKQEEKDGKKHSYRRPWSTTVFHVSQTEPEPTGEQIREYFTVGQRIEPDATIDTQGESVADYQGAV